jgi:Flp pilus assembly protein TadD
VARPARALLVAAFGDFNARRYTRVVDACRRLVDEDSVEAQLLLGLSLAALGETEAGAGWLASVARLRPDHRHPLLDLADLLGQLGQIDAFERHATAAMALAPRDGRVVVALAGHLAAHDRVTEALGLLQNFVDAQARDVQPGDAAAHVLLGILRDQTGDLDGSEAQFRAAIQLRPDLPAARANLGRLLADRGRFDEALACFDQAVRRDPNDVQVRINHAIALLKRDPTREGWRAYEWRLRLPGHTRLPPARMLPDLADVDLAGKTLLLTHEEGFGDTLQCLRFVPLLATRGARVLLHVPQPLVDLARRMGVATVLTGDIPVLSFDWHCPMLSLPRALATTAASIPLANGYLDPDPALVVHWAARLPQSGARGRVGIVWAGAARADQPAAAATDRRRSLPLAIMLPPLLATGVELISLQMGPASAQREGFPALHDPMTDVRDFHDTAAIIANLDMVVSVDTAVVHLAAAMGKPTLMLDRYDNCWRWGHGTDTSPWYAALRIFRQDAPGQWSAPLARLAAALASGVGRPR